MDNQFWKWLWKVALLIGIVAGVATTYAHADKVPPPVLHCLIGVCIALALVGLILDFKPWRWRCFQRKKTETAASLLLEYLQNFAADLRRRTFNRDTAAASILADYSKKNLELARLNDLLARVCHERQAGELVGKLVEAIERANSTYDDVRGSERGKEPNSDILEAELKRRIGRIMEIAELIAADARR
jgi:hypothetical protein